MRSFDKWRREVNIILQSVKGVSLSDLDPWVEDNARLMFNNGEEPVIAAQDVVDQLFPFEGIDVEQTLTANLPRKEQPRTKK
jgi:hypothetical protein